MVTVLEGVGVDGGGEAVGGDVGAGLEGGRDGEGVGMVAGAMHAGVEGEGVREAAELRGGADRREP